VEVRLEHSLCMSTANQMKQRHTQISAHQNNSFSFSSLSFLASVGVWRFE
jgi:hypothetical protein